MTHRLPKYIKCLLISLLCVIMLLIGMFGFIQTSWAKKRLAVFVSDLASNDTYTVECRGITGFLPFNIGVERITMSDGQGDLLEARDVSLDWSPLTLLSEKIQIHSVSTRETTLVRLPKPSRNASAETRRQQEPFSELPHIRIEQFHFPHNELSRELAGENMVVALNGSLQAASLSSLTTKLAVERTDQDGFNGSLKAHHTGETLRVLCDISAPPDGLLQRLPYVHLKDELRLRLEGNGPLDAWKGRLTVYEGKTRMLDAGFRLGFNSQSVQFNAEGSLRPPQELLTEAQRDLIVGEQPTGFNLQGKYHRKEARVTFKSAKLMMPAADVTSSGSFNFGENSIDTTFAVDIPKLQVLNTIPNFNTGGLNGGLTLTGDLKGQPNTGQLRSSLKLEARNLAGLPRNLHAVLGPNPTVQTNVVLEENGAVRFSSTRLKAEHTTVTAEGTYILNENRMDMGYTLKIPDLTSVAVLDDADISGELDAAGSLSGPLPDISVQAQGTITRMSFRGYNADTLDFEISDFVLGKPPSGELKLGLTRRDTRLDVSTVYNLKEGLLTLSKLRLTAPETQVTGNTRLMISEGILDSTLNVKAEKLRWLGSFLPVTPKGELQMDARIEGDIANPDVSLENIDGGLELKALSIGSIGGGIKVSDIKDRQQVKAQLEAGDIGTDHGTLDELSVELAGKQETGYEIDVQTRGSVGRPFEANLRGNIRLMASEQVVELNSGNVTYAGVPVTWLKPLILRRSNEKLEIRCKEGELGGGTFHLQLHKTAEKLKGQVRVHNFQLNKFEGKPVSFFTEGQLDADLKLSGSLQKPEADLVIEFQDMTSVDTEADVPNRFSGKLRANYQENAVKGFLKATNKTGDTIEAEAKLPFVLSLEPFKAKVAGDLQATTNFSADAGSFSPLFLPSSQRFSGQLLGKLRVSGEVKSPSLRGDISLKDGTYENAVTGTILQSIRIDCKIEDKTLKLIKLQATDGKKGSLTGSGHVETGGKGIRGAILLELEDMEVIQTETATGTVGGQISLKISHDASSVEGDLRFAPVELSIPDPRPKGMAGITVTQSSTQEQRAADEKMEAAPSFADNIALDLDVTLPDRCFIRGRGLNSEWSGDLRISGTLGEPKIGGQITVVRGYVDFLTKRFGLKESTVRFLNQTPPSPMLDITAVNERNELTTRVQATGSVDDPDISLYSEPPYPRDEILARLMFGKDLGQITPMQAVRLALAVRTLTGRGGGITERLRTGFGIDQLELRTTEEGQTVAGIGKYVAEDVYFRVEQNVGGDMTQVIVEVELTPHLSLETRTGTMTEGVDFKWSYRY